MIFNATFLDKLLNQTIYSDGYYRACLENNSILPFMFSKSRWIPHAGAALAYILIIQNIIIIRIFLKKNVLSTASILLSVLALSDTMSAFFWFVPEHIGSLCNFFNGSAFGSYSLITARDEQYPFCIIAFLTRNVLSSGFHSSSIVITTVLGIQKSIVLMFPKLSSSVTRKKNAVYLIFGILTVCLGLEVPYLYFFDFDSPNDNFKCCKRLRIDSIIVRRYFDFSHYFRSFLLLVSILIQLITTSYITSKLTCLRKTVWRDSLAVRKRNRRSTVIVIYITLIFILTEFPSVVVSSCLELRVATDFTGRTLQYLPLIISLGSFFNFWLYLTLSQRFRKEVNVIRRRSSRRRCSSFIV